jgi:hypothetical protein
LVSAVRKAGLFTLVLINARAIVAQCPNLILNVEIIGLSRRSTGGRKSAGMDTAYAGILAKFSVTVFAGLSLISGLVIRYTTV